MLLTVLLLILLTSSDVAVSQRAQPSEKDGQRIQSENTGKVHPKRCDPHVDDLCEKNMSWSALQRHRNVRKSIDLAYFRSRQNSLFGFGDRNIRKGRQPKIKGMGNKKGMMTMNKNQKKRKRGKKKKKNAASATTSPTPQPKPMTPTGAFAPTPTTSPTSQSQDEISIGAKEPTQRPQTEAPTAGPSPKPTEKIQPAQPTGGPSAGPSSEPTNNPTHTKSKSMYQYTPNQAEWETFFSKVETEPRVLNHSPEGVLWLDPANWVPWDGTVYDPSSMSHEQFVKAICTSSDTIRGLGEVYSSMPPFADPDNPTKAEVDNWHAVSITHLRKLVGIDHPAVPDHCLFARALWGQQRRLTTMWDDAYPDDTCVGSANAHCGHGFLPSPEDQAPFLPPGHAPCTRASGSEGVSGSPKSDIPWSIKWVRVFCAYLDREGYQGGHVGPFWSREKFGFSFWDAEPGNKNSNAIFRGKWGGKVVVGPWVV